MRLVLIFCVVVGMLEIGRRYMETSRVVGQTTLPEPENLFLDDESCFSTMMLP